MKNTKINRYVGSTLLVTGCCVGAGMVGLPVVSVLAGFMPSTLAMLICYLFTTVTGLLLLEVTLWFDKQVNLATMSEFVFGKLGKVCTCVFFISLFYCLFVAYLDAAGQLFAGLLSFVFKTPVSREVGILVCTLVVSLCVFIGTRAVDGVNRGLVLGLVASYCILISLGITNVQATNLSHVSWSSAMASMPILLICFGYQNLVPSLTYYLERNINAIRFAIIVGNMIPFFVYALWNFVILGILSYTHSNDLLQADMVTELLVNVTGSDRVVLFIKAFSLFAILTSFLPSAVSFVDFLKDGFKMTQIRSGQKLMLYSVIFIPPMISTVIYPHLFLKALGFAGGFIDILLFGVLPAAMVLVGRYVYKTNGDYQVAGGMVTPALILLSSIGVLMIKFY